MGMLSLFKVTPIYAACLGLLFVALSLNVVRLRWKFKTGIGDGGHRPLNLAMRAHGNCAENIAIALLLMAFVEVGRASTMTLHIIGSSLLIGRSLHAFGLSKSAGTSLPRILGMVLTFSSILISSLALLFNAI